MYACSKTATSSFWTFCQTKNQTISIRQHEDQMNEKLYAVVVYELKNLVKSRIRMKRDVGNGY